MNWIDTLVTVIIAGLSFGIGMGVASLFVKKQKEQPAAYWLITGACAVLLIKLSERYFSPGLTKWISSMFS